MNRHAEPIAVEAGSLLLRPWSVDDAAQVASVALDAEIRAWNPVTVPAHEWCAGRADWSQGTHASWAVVWHKDPRTIVGAVSLHHIDEAQLDSEVGYWVAPGHRRRGVAARAVAAAAGFAFDRLELHRVHLFHAVANVGSCAVATAAGFAYEGTHRQSYRVGDGPWHDEHSHARLSTDPG